MDLFGRDIKLAIFDLDGTLIDSTSIWADIDRLFFERRGMQIPPSYNMEIAHVGLTKAAEITKSKYVPDESIEDIMKEWRDLSIEEYEHRVPLKNNARELLELFYKNKIPIVLATANSEEIYKACLSRLDILKYFSLALDVNSCKEGKNSPEIYDKASTHFRVDRKNTIIFEDTLVPIKTAYKAGYTVVAVYDRESTKDIEACINNSHLFITDFADAIERIEE